MRKQAAELLQRERQSLLGLEEGYLDAHAYVDFDSRGGVDPSSHCSAMDGSCQAAHHRDPYASPSVGLYSRVGAGYEHDGYEHDSGGVGGAGQDSEGRGIQSNGRGAQRNHYHRDIEDRRGLSDRQLQEQLARLLGGDDVQMPRDDPLVVLTLTGGCKGD